METQKNGAPPLPEEAPRIIIESHLHIKDSTHEPLSRAKAINKIVWTAEEIIAIGSLDPKYLLENFLPQAGLAALVGPPGIGKSQLARQFATEIGSGSIEFLGRKLTLQHHSALYVLTEDLPEMIGHPLSKQRKGLGNPGR
jgi:hypothetical protein